MVGFPNELELPRALGVQGPRYAYWGAARHTNTAARPDGSLKGGVEYPLRSNAICKRICILVKASRSARNLAGIARFRV